MVADVIVEASHFLYVIVFEKVSFGVVEKKILSLQTFLLSG